MTDWFWWAALAVVAVSAVAHLTSMLGTRWGDRAASSKALLFSLLIHLAIGCGLFAVAPQLEGLVAKTTSEPPPPITIRDLVDPDREPSEPSPEGLRPWERPVETAQTPRERAELPTEPPIEAADSVRERTPPADALPTEPAAVPEVAAAVPEAAAADVPRLTAPAADSPMLTEDTAVARGESVELERQRSDRDATISAVPQVERTGTAAPPQPERVGTVGRSETMISQPLPTELPQPLADAETGIARPVPAASIERPEVGAPAAEPAAEVAESRGSPSFRFNRRPMRGPSGIGAEETPERASLPAVSSANAPPSRELASVGVGRGPLDLPELRRPDATPLRGDRGGMPETYQLRQLERRREVARANGGSEASEQAVELALKWLASTQSQQGFWDADAYGAGKVGIDENKVDRQFAGRHADSGLTGLSLLAFLGAGHTREEGSYTQPVGRAIGWLVSHQREDGYLGYGAAHFEQMYCHGMATYALAEAYGMRAAGSRDDRLRGAVERAVGYIASQQGEDGGWRYVKGQEGDMSMFGWQLMALKSAEIAGVPVPAETRAKMIAFLRARGLGESGGLASYRPELPATAPMTAEAMFCKQMLGMSPANPASVEAARYLLSRTPRRSQLDYYYWYYGTLAMFQQGGEPWERWNAALRDLLVAEQVQAGPAAGSWEPRDAWGPYGGRIYSTAVATMSLEVYYRFLPLYRVGGER